MMFIAIEVNVVLPGAWECGDRRIFTKTPNPLGNSIFKSYDFFMGIERPANALRTSWTSLGPGAFAIKLGLLLPVSLVLGYLALMPVMLLPDVSLKVYTALYITAAALALPAILATIAGTWILYTYLYSVTVPIVRSMEQGRSLAHLAITVTGEKLLRTLIGLVHAWALLLGLIGRESALYLPPSLLRSPIRLGIPVHLAIGWRAGTHPQVLYATTLP